MTEIATYADEGSGYNEEDVIVYSATGVLSSLWSAKTPYVDTWGFFVDLTNGRDLDLLPGRTVPVANLNKGYNIALVGNEWVSWGSAVISGGLLQVSNVMRGLFDSSPEDHLPGERVWFPLGSNIIRQDLDVLQGGTGTPGQAGTDGQSIIWRGVYSDSTPYFAYDVVRYNGAVYIATADSTGSYPDLNPDYWDLMTEDGADGVDGESSFVATSVQVVTASLAPNSTETASIAIRKTANILKIVTDYPCWVRLYGSSAERSADSSRPITEDSLPGKGCFFDGSSSPGELEISSEPVPVFVNHDSPRVDFGYISIKNLDSTNRVITVTVHYVPLEA